MTLYDVLGFAMPYIDYYISAQEFFLPLLSYKKYSLYHIHGDFEGYVSVIGLVFDKKRTKNGHILFILEDPTGVTKVLISSSHPQYSEFDMILLDTAIAIDGNVKQGIIFFERGFIYEKNEYSSLLLKKCQQAYIFAENVLQKKPDTILTYTLYERVAGLISSEYPYLDKFFIVNELEQLEKKYGFLDWRVAFEIAYKVALLDKFTSEKEAILCGIRVGFAYITSGVVSSPLEGLVDLDIVERKDKNGKFLRLFFAGPIRNAGATSVCVCVLITEYLREKFNFSIYDPTDDEIKRAQLEIKEYHEKITPLQYYPNADEIACYFSQIPICIDGEKTESISVSSFTSIERIKTDYIRGGFCLVLAECLCGRAKKVYSKLQHFKDFLFPNFSFLEILLNLQKNKHQEDKKNEILTPQYTYIENMVAGRAVFGMPLTFGGLRLRYGRSRVSGMSACSIHPATMVIADEFLAFGTQLKMERPGKGCTITSCDSICGPIVLLDDESVVSIKSFEEALQIKSKVKKILFLGDILISYGDFLDRGHRLVPCGYNEEWWKAELLEKNILIPEQIDFYEAVELSKKYNIGLHPKYTHFWSRLNKKEFIYLLSHITKNSKEEFCFDNSVKQLLEKICVSHFLLANNICLSKESSLIFFSFFTNENIKKMKLSIKTEVLDVLFDVLKFSIRDTVGTFIGARMGRPEKAKMRARHDVQEDEKLKILRNKYKLSVFKDGTVRYDATEDPITHFKPKEIQVTVSQLKQLGYSCDIYGNKLTNENQIIELFAQDVIIPCNDVEKEQSCDEIFLRVGNFVDEDLVQRGFSSFYNFKKQKDLLGQLVVCLAPHTSAASLLRIIGFSKTKTILCHPFMHAAVRRDCDGDEMGLILLMDMLLHFNSSYLPKKRGGKMDAPFVLTPVLHEKEVDDMVFNVDIAENYPLSFYQAALEYKYPWEVSIVTIKDYIENNVVIKYTHESENINNCVLISAYKKLPSMQEKIVAQLEVAKKIVAVDENFVAKKLIERHLLKEMRTNFSKFFIQEFRCVECNTIYRRVPLRCSCLQCGGKLQLTITEGMINKYIFIVDKIVEEFEVDEQKKLYENFKLEYINTFEKNIPALKEQI